VSTWRLAWRLATYRPRLFAASVALWAAFHTVPLATGVVTGLFFDAVTGEAAAGLNVWTVIALLVAIEAMQAGVFFGAAVIWIFYWNMLETVLRTNMLDWIVRGPGARRLPGSPGEVVSRFRDDTEAVLVFIDTWLDVTGTAIFTLAAIGIMAAISPTITVVVLLPLAATVAITRLMTSRIRRYRRAYREATASVTSFIGESFGAIHAIKVGAAEPHVTRRFEELGDVRRRAAVRDRLFSELLASYSLNAGNIGVGIVLLLSAGAMRSGELSVGEFAIFASYLSVMPGLPRWLGWLMARHRQSSVSIERMAALMKDARPDALVRPAEIYLDGPPPEERRRVDEDARLERLEVEGLTYRHAGSAHGVEGVDLAIERGSFTVLTGRVGSGKTTLLRALLGLVEPQGGEVRWNGTRVEDAASFFVPPRCAYTPQTPRLVSETLRDNIRLGEPASEELLGRAVYQAVIEDDVAEMEHGLATVIGPRGVRLSGGQVQRSAAARMFVRHPELLVFDDISSALDVETERTLWQRLFEEEAPTCLVVSNRRVGTLEELLERSEEMRTLWAEEEGRLDESPVLA
jgi:ATP-binding cassette subfamily B protein